MVIVCLTLVFRCRRVADYWFDQGDFDKATDFVVKSMICFSNHLKTPKVYKGYEVGTDRPEVSEEDPTIMKYSLNRFEEYFTKWYKSYLIPVQLVYSVT